VRLVPPTRVVVQPGMASCPWCDATVEPGRPFCSQCGRRTDARLSAASACPQCGAAVKDEDVFCAGCGGALERHDARATVEARASGGGEARTLVFSARRQEAGPRLAVVAEDGTVRNTVSLARGELTIGRSACDLAFSEDSFVSPLHAQLLVKEGAVIVRDLGSANHTWLFTEAAGTHVLADDDLVLVGSQLLQFRRIGSPPPTAAAADGTRRIGSFVPGPDVAVLAQLRADGSMRDCLFLGAGRAIVLGRDTGDWTFPYDRTMSGRHAEVREEEGQFVIRDLGSRNGIAVAVRGERRIAPGQRLMVGDQMLRLESV